MDEPKSTLEYSDGVLHVIDLDLFMVLLLDSWIV